MFFYEVESPTQKLTSFGQVKRKMAYKVTYKVNARAPSIVIRIFQVTMTTLQEHLRTEIASNTHH